MYNKKRGGSMDETEHRSPIWPIILISIGIIFLLKNFNLVSANIISNAVKLWPLILVYLGLDYWTRSNPRLRTIVTILFISGVVFAILFLSDQSAAFWR
jgi:hypothetical protein